jgi:hypothetical protein
MASTRKSKLLKIIGQTNLVSDIIDKSGGIELVLKRYLDPQTKTNTYLSDVFDETPPGFLYKDETGMGATTLELGCNRNSIIVEPIKITASSKASQHGTALYVGGSTRYHPRKAITEIEILDYLLDTSINPKKIIVVADSLPKVMDALGDLAFKNFFFLIDEIDSFQLDSTFRRSMEYALSIYKKFPPESRAMLSATKIQFSDPILKREPITFVRYDIPSVRKINVITCPTGNVISVAAEVIGKLIQSHQDEKFLIAFNSVSGSYDLSEYFVKSGLMSEQEITILCSKNSQVRVGKYYKELNSDKLPTRLTFITSAFFTGFDLYDQYHLVSLSSSLSKVFSLSERRLKQIAGRSRNPLLSETVIHDIVTAKEKFELTEQKMIHAASIQLSAMDCMTIQYGTNVLIGEHLSDITQRILNTFEEKVIGYIYLGADDKYHISYLFIDAQLEIQRVRKSLYTSPDALYKKLISDGNQAQQHMISSKTDVTSHNVLQGSRDDEITEILECLDGVTDSYTIRDQIALGFMTQLQKSICEAYLQVVDYVDTSVVFPMISDALIRKRDTRAFDNLLAKIFFLTLPTGYLPVDRIDAHFPIGSTFTKDEIFYRMNLFNGEMNLGKVLSSNDSAIRMLKIYRRITKIPRGNKVIDIKISHKPTIANIILKQKKSIYNLDDLNFFTSYYRKS